MSFLILMFVVILVTLVMSFAMAGFFASSHREVLAAIGFVVSGIVALSSLVALIVYVGLAFDYMSSGYKARILNDEYGTNYTQQDVFFASSVIDTVRELDRKRFEVNGDLMRKGSGE